MRHSGQRAVCLPAAVLLGCVIDQEPPAGFSWGPEQACAAPVSGFDRLTEEGAQRGLTWTFPDPETWITRDWEGFGGNVAAEDIDGDGDFDLVVLRGIEAPLLYRNDGTGHFQMEILDAAEGDERNLVLLDWDGDSTIDLVTLGNAVRVRFGHGGNFQPATELFRFDAGPINYRTMTAADLDADGDLDLAAVGQGMTVGRPPDPAPDLLLLGDGSGGLEGTMELRGTEGGSTSQAAVFVDRDGDGDPDLFVPTNSYGLGAASVFWRNDGARTFTDDTADLGVRADMAAMGMDHLDWNGDGLLDLCVTDVGPVRCWESAPGGYLDSTAALGLTSDFEIQVGWSFSFFDLDHDGVMDAAQASGPDFNAFDRQITEIPDLLWQGRGDGSFEERSASVGFGDPVADYGLVAADFDGDGWIDLLLTGPGRRPLLFMNRCGDGAWTEIDLIGPSGMTQGLGALVTVEAGGLTFRKELWNLRAQAQEPSVVHVGLGEVDLIDRLSVRWPDGRVSEAVDLPTRRRIVVEADVAR